jgi:hypothetical protein
VEVDMAGPPSASRFPASTATLVVAAVVVGLGAITFLAGTVAPAFDGLRFGFPAYYTSSRLVLEGGWTPGVYDDAWFHARSLELTGGRVAEIYRPNTPMMSLLALPVAGLDLQTARRLWLAVDMLLVVVTLVALFAALPVVRSPPRALLVIGLALWWAPLRETIGLGQAYALMLALQAIALWAAVGGRPAVTGLTVGLAVATKLAAVPLLLVLAVRGSVRSVAVAVATILALAVLTIGFAGADGWLGFGRALVEDAVHPPASLSVTAYQSTTGFFGHLLTVDPVWNPDPIVALSWLATVATLTATGLALGLTLWLGRTGPVDLAVAAAVTCGVLVLNLAQEYHFAMLLVPAAVALARWFEVADRPVLDGLWLTLSLALLAAPVAYESPSLAGGWLALFAYPRLYGAWLLWGWLMREAWLARSPVVVERAGAADRYDGG